MSEAPPANVQAATPAPGSQTSSPVNAQSASSKANQQAAAAGEAQGLSNKDQAQQAPAHTPPAEPTAQASEGQASLEAPRYKQTGNQTIDQISSLLHNKQFDGSNDIIDEVIDNQELSLTSKAKLVDQLGADVAQLVINQLESSVAAEKQKGEQEGKRLKEYAYSKFGGSNPDETWAGLQQFAQSDQSLSAEDRSAMNEMLSKGGKYAELVIDSLYSKYKESLSLIHI